MQRDNSCRQRNHHPSPARKGKEMIKEKLSDSGLSEKLFQQFVDELNAKGLIFNEGQIIDASFVLAPKAAQYQRREQRYEEDSVNLR